MTIAKIVGKKIMSVRKSQKLSQSELAKLADVDRSFISEIENGKKNVSISVLEKIAKALNTSIVSLLEDTPSKES